LLRPQFHHKQYADLEIFREAVDNLLDHVPNEGGIIDLQPLFFSLTLDTTTAFLFGESVQSLKKPESANEETFAKFFNIAQEYVAKRFRLMDLYWLIGGKKFQDACRTVHRFADQIIDRNLSVNTDAIEENENKYIFLRTLAKDTPDRAAIRGQVINILVAGRDTTACLLSWTLWVALVPS
jgi:cytochrome P450